MASATRILTADEIQSSDLTKTWLMPPASGTLMTTTSGWSLSGNAGTTPGTNFLGTTDAQDLYIKTNGITQVIYNNTGGFSSLQTYVPVDNTTRSFYLFQTTANPTGPGTNANLRSLEVNATYDQINSGFSNTGSVSSIFSRWEHDGSGTLAFGSVFDGSTYFGSNNGTTSLYKGLNLDTGVADGHTITNYYGISDTANVGAATIGNWQSGNFSFAMNNTTVTGGISGINISPGISGTATVGQSLIGLGSYPYVNNTGDVTNNVIGIDIGPQLNDSSSTNNLQAINAYANINDSAQVQNMSVLNMAGSVFDTAVVTGSYTGISLSLTSVPTVPSVTGINVSVNGTNVTDPFSKTVFNGDGGSFGVNYSFTLPGATAFFQTHYLGGGTTVANGDPASAFGFGTNLAQTVNFQDDWSLDGAGLGYVDVGFVGSLIGGAGKTMDRWTGALGGAGNPSGSGTLVDAIMFRAGGVLPQGGSLAVTNMYGFQVDPALFCIIGTNCWGVYEATAAAENHLSKLAIDTSTKKVANASTALEIGSTKTFLNGRGTTAQKNALTALAGMQFYDTDLNDLQWYNGTSWISAAGGGSGTVTSVALADGSTSPIYAITGSPVTTSGTLTFTLSNQSANTVFAGPTVGGAAQPTFRSLVVADIPALPYASSTLTDSHIFVGNVGNVATDVAVSGDLTLANTGAFTIANLAVTNAKIANATIDLTTKVTGVLPIANGGTNSSAVLSNNRVMQSSGGAIVEAAAITANRALISDANGIPTHSVTTATELSYVSGVTSSIQTQLNAKQASFTWAQETPAGAVDNSNVTFTLAHAPTADASVHLYQDGLILVQGTDYTISGATITMTTAPNFAQTLYADYSY